MKKIKNPGDEAFLKVLRPLIEVHRAVMRKDDQHILTLDLTQAQFDVIVVLGDTPGMPCNKITEETLLTNLILRVAMGLIMFPHISLGLLPMRK